MLNKKAAAAAAVLTLSVGSIVATAPAAEAVPNGCSKWVTLQNNSMWANSRCTGGNGWQRVRTFCSWFGAGYTAYGPWVKAGQTSTAACGKYAATTSIVLELVD